MGKRTNDDLEERVRYHQDRMGGALVRLKAAVDNAVAVLSDPSATMMRVVLATDAVDRQRRSLDCTQRIYMGAVRRLDKCRPMPPDLAKRWEELEFRRAELRELEALAASVPASSNHRGRGEATRPVPNLGRIV